MWSPVVIATADVYQRQVFIHMMFHPPIMGRHKGDGHHTTNNALLAPPNGSTLRLYHIKSIYHRGFPLMTKRRLAMLYLSTIIITTFLWVSMMYMYVMWMARSESGLIPR